MFKLFLITLITLLAAPSTWSLNQAIEIPVTIDQTYFDSPSLAEILNPVPDEEIDLTTRRIEDFFASSSFAFVIEPNSRFYILPDVESVNIFQIPATQRQSLPSLAIDLNLNQKFAWGYVRFLEKNLNELVTIVKRAYYFKGIETSEHEYNFFYTCLRSMAVTTRSSNCIDTAIQALRFADRAEIRKMADAYIKLYRASRITFTSNDPIETSNPQIVGPCRNISARLKELDSLVHVKTDTIGNSIFSSVTMTQSRNFYYAKPSTDSIKGANFRIIGENGLQPYRPTSLCSTGLFNF